MLNKVILMGRLCADPDFRQTTSGIPVCRIRVAVDRGFRGKDQERQADFINVVCWRQTAEFVSRYFSKGKMIIVEGSLRNADYTDNNGVKHYAMEVQADNVSFGESKGNSDGNGGGYQNGNGGYQGNAGYQNGNGYQSNNGYQQPRNAAPAQKPAPAESMQIGDLGDFEEILSDGEVPF